MGLKYNENRGYMICENPRVYSYITSDEDLIRIDQTTDFEFKDDSLAKFWNPVDIKRRYKLFSPNISKSLPNTYMQFASTWAKFMQHILVKNNLSWDKPWEELDPNSTVNIIHYSHFRVWSINNYFPIFFDPLEATDLVFEYWKHGEMVFEIIDNYGLWTDSFIIY